MKIKNIKINKLCSKKSVIDLKKTVLEERLIPVPNIKEKKVKRKIIKF